MSRKNKTKIALNVRFTGIADRGKAVGRTEENEVVFAQGPVPGDIADVLLIKKRKGVYQGIVKNYLSYGDDRVKPFCEHFEMCGGCKWQHLLYSTQLSEKETIVRDAFQRIAKVEPKEFLPIVGGKFTKYYRNKLEFSFSNKRWLSDDEVRSDEDFGEVKALGFHAPGSFDKIVPIDHCYLQAEPSNEIRNFIRDFTIEHNYTFWDARKHTGLMRNMIIRTSSIGETMLTVVFSKFEEDLIKGLMDAILAKFPDINSLMYVVNEKMNDTLFDQEFILYHGKKEISEKMGDIEYRLSPKSFFQTNTNQSKILYDIALDFADFKGHELVYDLYTGIGSIALYLAHKVKKVIGIELIDEAIQDAIKNAKINQIDNAEFYTGDVKDTLTSDFEKPDVVIIDPPRAGIHKEVVGTIMELTPEKLVYVSCNPATQARDIALFHAKYDLIKLQPVDMFPHTHHIESVALLQLRK